MRASFRLKLAALTAACAAIPLVAVGWMLVDVHEREAQSSSQALQIALAERVAERAEAELERGRSTLEAIARALADGDRSDDARLALALGLLEAEPSLDGAAVYDAERDLIDRMRLPDRVASTPPRLADSLADRAGADGFAVVVPNGEGAARALLVVPLRAGDRVTGWVAGSLSLDGVQALVERLSRAQLASDGAVMVMDEARRAIAHPTVSDRAALDDPADGADLAALPSAPTSHEVTRAGRRWVTTVVPIRGAPWVAVSEMPRDVVYASVDQTRRVVIGTILAALLLAVLAATLLARRLSAPIGRLVAFADHLAARRFSERVTIETGDELAVLGDALSHAAEELEASEARVREEEAIRADLGRYLPAELVEQVIRREQSMELGGRRRAITVLFADVVAFTPLSERLPPERTVALLNELFTLLTEAVFRHGGTVDKFVGDCVMALFGAPAAHEDHAARALAAARDMLRFLESANAAWREDPGVEVQLAIGINTGEAVVGNVGSATRMEYTAIGDVVNVAARLEAIARPGQILVTRATMDAAGEEDAARVGEREVPGRSAPVELFEVRW